MHCFSTSGSLSAAQTLSRGAGMRWLSFICMVGLLLVRERGGGALAAAAGLRDLGEYRHRDLLGRDGAEIEPGRRFDAVDRGGVDAFLDQFFAQRRHLAAAADE